VTGQFRDTFVTLGVTPWLFEENGGFGFVPNHPYFIGVLESRRKDLNLRPTLYENINSVVMVS
jgi:hypothetical protein